MQSSRKKTIFITELSIILAMLIVSVAVLGSFIAMCKNRSDEASVLNDSVILASNAAEAAKSAADDSELRDALSSVGSVRDSASRNEIWTLATLDNEDYYLIKLTRTYSAGSDNYAESHIEVYKAGDGESDASDAGPLLYELDSGICFGREAGS